MQNAILYQAYGGTQFVNECRYSLLKYLQVYNLIPPSSTAIFIYTDAPHAFADFIPFFSRFECVALNATTVAQWRGPNDFVHRFKIEMMADCFRRFTGNLLYCDTDTYATTSLATIFSGMEAGGVYMHEYEGVVDKTRSPQFAKWEKFLAGTSVAYGNKQVQFSKDIQLFNAGVVGLSSSKQEWLRDVLALTDAIYQKFPKHIAEQVAFSYCLQQNERIKEAKAAIAHYWNLKEFRHLLEVFFAKNEEESIPALVKKIHHLNALDIMKEKQAFEGLPLPQRLFKKITGKAWRIANYERKL